MIEQVSTWGVSRSLLTEIVERENYLCTLCSSNFRKRAVAQTVLDLLKINDVDELAITLHGNPNISMYETACHEIFVSDSINKCSNYIVSEYFDGEPAGAVVNGVRNENLESLTFADNTFDVVITSDVLEHVADLGAALQEIRRVLKPGGYHVFSVPVDVAMPKMRDRAILTDCGVKHLCAPVYHGDTIRGGGILTFRDFGADIVDVMSRDGFICKENIFLSPLRQKCHTYYARKDA